MKASDYDDDDLVTKVYYPEQVEVIKKVTGADKVVIFDHSKSPLPSHHLLLAVRTHHPAVRKNHANRLDDTPDTRTPVTYVHVDQTHTSTLARVHRHLPGSEASSRAAKRYQIINLWRPIGGPAVDRPLALCDWRSIDLGRDMEPQRLVYPEGMKEGETWGVKNHDGHRWVYKKGMEPEEIVLIKW